MSHQVGHLRLLLVASESEALRGFVRDLFVLDEHLESVVRHDAATALELIERESFDAVVSDLLLPRGGAEMVLTALRHRFPQILRFVLAADPCDATFARAAHLAHQLLPSPCDAGTFYAALCDQMTAAQRLLDPAVGGAILRITSLPESPAMRRSLLGLLADEQIDIERLEEALNHNPALVAKLLQIANSAFYGSRFTVTSVGEAVSLLGLDTVRGIITSAELFTALSSHGSKHFPLEEIWHHCIATAVMVRRLASRLRAGAEFNRTAFTAGLLHDVGKIVLYLAYGDAYTAIVRRPSAHDLPLWREETLRLGLHHASAGARLLEMWGLPLAIVEAVGLHHTPHRSRDEGPTPLTLVHLANALVHRSNPSVCFESSLDTCYLKRLLLPDDLTTWEATVADFA